MAGDDDAGYEFAKVCKPAASAMLGRDGHAQSGVRAGAQNEPPQWWGRAPEGKARGIQQGLWVPEDAAEDARVSLSTTAKPVQFKHW
ncbi:RNaseH domain-containing protein [Streptomyces sp. NPDC001939]